MTRPDGARARGVVATVMFCHFISAFAALGMPPFFALILERSLHSEASYLAGWFYVVPTLFAALSSPAWGRLADRFGKRLLLLRAQLGLAASFLLAGFATDATTFCVALILQGALGGTFAASNAYLATVAQGTALARGLTAMQWSARAALVAAPVCVGLWVGVESPIELYRYLALLPLIAALLIARLPDGGAAGRAARGASPAARVEATTAQIHALQFAFVFATVVTFPYFVVHVQARFPALSATWAGLMFGLPHLVYLALAMPLARRLAGARLLIVTAVAYAALFACLVGQVRPASVEYLLLWRLAMGAAMTAGFVALHAMIAAAVESGTAGRTFGWFESGAKWGGVAAGVGAGLAAAAAGPQAPFLVGAAVIAAALVYVAMLAAGRLRPTHP